MDMSQIKGGAIEAITGWRQDGSNSYVDVIIDGEVFCDYLSGSQNPEGWFETFTGDISGKGNMCL